MNRNQIWRMVACSTDTYNRHEEIHVFVDAPDYETAKSVFTNAWLKNGIFHRNLSIYITYGVDQNFKKCLQEDKYLRDCHCWSPGAAME